MGKAFGGVKIFGGFFRTLGIYEPVELPNVFIMLKLFQNE